MASVLNKYQYLVCTSTSTGVSVGSSFETEKELLELLEDYDSSYGLSEKREEKLVEEAFKQLLEIGYFKIGQNLYLTLKD